MHLNKLKLELKKITEGEVVEIESIRFRNAMYIKVYVDNNDLLDQYDFEGSFLVLDELRKSIRVSGRYLLFTSVSGMADDAGWDYVVVSHGETTVDWKFSRDEKVYHFKFDKLNYELELENMEKNLAAVAEKLTLEPSVVIYPE